MARRYVQPEATRSGSLSILKPAMSKPVVARPWFFRSLHNGKVGLAILCPITSQVKGYPFE